MGQNYNVSVGMFGGGTLRPTGWIDVRAYGATGDGTTDDSGFVQNANDAASGGVVYFPAGTYILDGITGAAGHWMLAKDAILKHKAGASAAPGGPNPGTNYMVYSTSDLEISGGVLDGNKASQTNRTSLVGFKGGTIRIHGCEIKNTVQECLRVHGANQVFVSDNYCHDIGEHGSVLNEDAMVFHVFAGEGSRVNRATFSNNIFINGAPTTSDVAPVAIAFSTANGAAGDCTISENTIVGFGTIFTGNPQGAIEVYQNCDRVVISDNAIYDAYNCGIRVADSGDVIVSNNVVFVESSSSTVPSAISVTAQGHDTTTKHNMQVVGNTVSNAAGTGGIYVAGGGLLNLLDGANVSDNIVIDSGADGIQFEYCGGNILSSNNVIKDCGTYGYFIKYSEGTMLISGGIIDNPTDAGIYCRDSVSSLDLTIDGLTVSNSGDLGLSLRPTSVNVINCIDIGSTRILDSEHTSGRVEGCSWQSEYQDRASGGTIDKDEQGSTFTNAGATGATTLVLPSVSTLPVGAKVRFIVIAAQTVYIDPNASDRIFPTCAADGYRLTNTGVIGSSVTLEYSHADGWSIVAESGTWTDAGS